MRYEFNLKFFAVAVIHFTITFFLETFAFNVSEGIIRLGIKSIVFIFLLLFYQAIPFVYRKIKSSEIIYVNFLKYFLFLFIIMIFCTILTWPGVWHWDEFNILNDASYYRINSWQHWLTSVFYCFSLNIFPFPAGIVIMQVLFISILSAVSIAKIINSLKLQPKYGYLFCLVFLSPAAILMNLYLMRSTLCGYLEMFLIVIIICQWLDKKSFSLTFCLSISPLIAIISSWRSENILYVMFVPFILLISNCKHMKRIIPSVLCMVIVTASIYGGISYIQSYALKFSNNYSLTGMLSSLSAIVKTDFNSSNKENDLNIIDKVVSVEHLKESDRNTAVFLSSEAKDYSDKEFADFRKTFVRLALLNFPIVLENQFENFKVASALTSKTYRTQNLFEILISDHISQSAFKDNYILNKAIHPSLRTYFVSFIQMSDISGKPVYPFYGIFYSLIPPLVLVFATFIMSIIKKSFIFFSFSSLILCKACLIFLTAPPFSLSFMYWFSIYLCSYVMFIFILLAQKGYLKQV